MGAELMVLLSEFFQTTLFHLGKTAISPGFILYLVAALVGIFLISALVQRLLVHRVLPRYQMELGLSHTIGLIVRYFILIIGLSIVIQSTGIDLSSLGLLAGALGVGIGFGLQNITNNFISGIIVLFERPIKVGDFIEVGEITGDVVKIAIRSTTVVTQDNISVIVPNSNFIDSTVINWSHNERLVRFRFDVGVAYKENPEQVRQLLLEVAAEEPGVLDDPKPDVLFDAFGDSSLNFKLRVWTSEYVNRPMVLKSHLYYAIFRKFAQHRIEIPFPQRDLHIKSGLDLAHLAQKRD